MEFQAKTFEELSKEELYDLLSLRAEVFVVEQECAYQDVDQKDQKALHVLGYLNNELIAYTRIFKAGDYFDSASIGRVVVKQLNRGTDLGKELMKYSISVIETNFNTRTIELSAQEHLKKFYTDLGFKAVGSSYLEDGIPHIRMIKNA